MTFKLNEAPQLLMSLFLEINQELQVDVDKILQKRKHSVWPDNILVKQDKSMGFYVQCLAKLLLDSRDIKNIDEMTTWQAKQVYRILNATIASTDFSLTHFKDELNQFKKSLQESEEINIWLQDIEKRSIKPDVVCSGHANAKVEYGVVELDAETKLIMYIGIGATMGGRLGVSIENQRFYKNSVKVEDDNGSSLHKQLPKFPVVLDAGSERVPNFKLMSEKDQSRPARIIESETGEILIEEKDFIHLKTIVERLAGRRIHWASCAMLFEMKPTVKAIGPFVNYNWTKYRGDEYSSQERTRIYYRLFQPKKNLNEENKGNRPAKKRKFTYNSAHD